MKQYIYSALALTAVMGFTSCQNEEVMPSVDNATRQVTLTITADKGNYDTRTTMDVVDGDLVTYWETTDKLIVTNEVENGETAQNFGVLDYVSGAGTTKATFSNTIVIPADIKYVHVTYLGKKYTADLTDYTGNIEYSVANQTGSIADLTQNDVLTSYQPIAIPDGTANFKVEDVTLTRNFSYGYFELKDLPFTLAKGDVIKVSSPDGTLKVSQKIGVNKTSSTVGTVTNNTITITKGEAGNTFYLAMVPQTCSLQFEVTKDGIKYTATLGENTWDATEYYRVDANNTPITVSEWSEEKEPVNPLDALNWGSPDGTNLMPQRTVLGKTKTSDYGWTVNTDIYGNGGFGTYIRYDSNGITGTDLLFSDDNGLAYMYQWGRWMGFTPDAQNTQITSGGAYSGSRPNLSQAIPGVDYYNNYTIGYIWSDFAFCYEWTYASSNWTKEKSNDYAMIFAGCSTFSSTMDYMNDNNLSSWYERCGNPCPAGYRIPTIAELEALIPKNVEKINGSHAEIKTFNGVKYAIKWTVNSSTSIKRLEIRSIKTDKSSVTTNDAIFNDAPVIYLHALGYMQWNAKYTGKNNIGAYWSSDSGQLEDISANGGRYLEIDFDGSTATMGIATTYTSMGLCVIPFKDDSQPSKSITPLFPLK